ncbi:MAG TPA: hypothetical protein VFU35_10355 [Jatrophihabitans sp.]|nr:hypothetical protein [Jatrophihabitans sp.]
MSHDAGSAGDAGRLDGEHGPWDNGLHAPRYVPLTDVDAAIAQHLLTALGRARIPAYLAAAADTDRRRLFVSSDERGDARTIVAAAVRALDDGAKASEPADPLLGLDTDAAFDALVADWHVDTVAAVRDAERDLTREDAEWRARLNPPQAADETWLDEDHYVPPPPPPLPRLARPTIAGIVVLVASILMLAFGTYIGFADNLTLVLGIGGLVLAAGIFFTRVRDHQRDEDDDGSAV